MKAVVAAFNQEKALVGAFSVITNLRMDFFEALVSMITNFAFISATVCSQPPEPVPDRAAVSQLGDAPCPEGRGGEYSEFCLDRTHFVFAASIFGESEIIPHLIAAGSGRLERHGQRHDIPDPAAAQCAQKVNPGMRDRNRENQTNARTPLDKLLQASSDIRYCYTVSQTSFLEKIF